jgi:adenylylsulfate kinase
MGDQHSRTLIKTLTWRVLATTTTVVIVFLFTGKLVLSLSIGGVELFAKLAIYYVHERIWDKIKWGHKH